MIDYDLCTVKRVLETKNDQATLKTQGNFALKVREVRGKRHEVAGG